MPPAARYLIEGPHAFSAGVGSGIGAAVRRSPQAVGAAGEAEGAAVGGDTQEQLLGRCSQSQPVGDGRVLPRRRRHKHSVTG